MALARASEDGQGPAFSFEAGRDKGGMRGGGGQGWGGWLCGVAARRWAGSWRFRLLLLLPRVATVRALEILSTWLWSELGEGLDREVEMRQIQ